MGCSSSHFTGSSHPRKFNDVAELLPDDIDVGWQCVSALIAKTSSIQQPQFSVTHRVGWKTIRIFVSSTFKDFDAERETLVKKVFPELQLWCQSRRLHLVEVDLRWGIPKDLKSEEVLQSCFSEIDRCYSENIFPFFINLTGERIGWIPTGSNYMEVMEQLSWISGMSVTEMEIIRAVYKCRNPNALFMIRDPDFIERVPETYQKLFLEDKLDKHMAAYKTEKLKGFIKEHASQTRKNVYVYNCEFSGVSNNDKVATLSGLDDSFVPAIIGFFKDRIASQYPLDVENGSSSDNFEDTKSQHESFLRFIAARVVGRDAFVSELVTPETKSHLPVLVCGNPGMGKSSVMALLAVHCLNNTSYRPHNIFFHFVGAVSGSTNLLSMLNRLLSELVLIKDKTKLPKTLEEAMGTVRMFLSKTAPVERVIIVDAVNQFDELSSFSSPLTWIPEELGANVRLFVSVSAESQLFNQLRELHVSWNLIQLQPLDKRSQEKMVCSYLSQYSKKLDAEDMKRLLGKRNAGNPLWLALATEELRVFGRYREISQQIDSFRDGLIDFEEDVLGRLERENNGVLLVATLCLLETSVKGLLETELLELLSRKSLLPAEIMDLLQKNMVALFDSKCNQDANSFNDNCDEKITAVQWNDIYRALRLFIRPFGASGEGRLDFYHRSISKAVRKRYFLSTLIPYEPSDDKNGKQKNAKLFFHRTLADYFETSCLDIERCLEEYPTHAWSCGDGAGLLQFLTRWTIFDAMFSSNVEFSRLFSQNWALAYDLYSRASKGNFDENKAATSLLLKIPTAPVEVQFTSLAARFMQRSYVALLDVMCRQDDGENPSNVIPDTIPLTERLERVIRVFMQNGRYVAGSLLADRLIALSTIRDNSAPMEMETSADAHRFWQIGFVYLKAQVFYESMRSQSKMSRRQLTRIFGLITFFEDVIDCLKKCGPRDTRLGRSLNSVAFFYACIAKHNNFAVSSSLTSQQAKELALSRCEQAIEFYLSDKEKMDMLELTDCYITRGVCECDATQSQLDFFMRAHDLALEHFGVFHPVFDRIYFYIANYYEEIKAAESAYVNFKKWYDLLVTVFGATCPRTRKAAAVLNRGVYKRFAAKLGHTVPTMSVQSAFTDQREEDEDELTGADGDNAI